MGEASTHGRWRSRLVILLLVALALTVVLAVGAQSALAYSGWLHDGDVGGPTSCTQCHPSGTGQPGTNAACQVCHTTQTLRSGYNCWSCHRPGTSVAAVACNSCHTFSGGSATAYNTAFSHDPHVGSNLKACTTCHTNIAANNPMHSNADVPAPTCTTCHKATPVDGAPVPHDPFVAAVACSTCHKGVDPNHPLSADVVTPTLTFVAKQPVGAADVTLAGSLKKGTAAAAGVIVYLQSTPNGTAFTDVTSVTTATNGSFSYTVVGATAGLSYRAVAQGVAGPPVVLPAVQTAAVTPPTTEAITLKLNGLTTVTIAFGKSVTAKGAITPKLILSEVVKLQVQKWRPTTRKWVALPTLSTAKTIGSYTKAYRPGSRGMFRMRAVLAANALHTKATSLWRTFKVK